MAQWMAPAATAGSGLFGSWIASNRSKKNTEKTIEANKELAQYQYEQEQQQLEYMNKYNLPANQKQRLIDAHLNPALMYNSAPQNVQTQLAKYDRPNLDYSGIKPIEIPNPARVLTETQDVRIKQAQTNNLLAQRENIEMDTALKAVTKGKQLADTAKTRLDTEIADELKKYTYEYAKENTWKKSHERVNEAARNQGILTENENKRLDMLMKQEDLNLRKQGIYPGDPMYIRMLMKNKEIQKIMEVLKKQ